MQLTIPLKMGLGKGDLRRELHAETNSYGLSAGWRLPPSNECFARRNPSASREKAKGNVQRTMLPG
jgi:hypothetical protein